MDARILLMTLALAAVAPLAIGGCDDVETEAVHVVPTPPEHGAKHERLSDWHLFADLASLTPAERVVPYVEAAPLFTDYTTKFRWVYLPPGTKATYSDDGVYELPLGTVLVKTFAYRADARDLTSRLRLLETRLLFREPEGWSAETYIWNDAGDDAVRAPAGDGGSAIHVAFVDAKGNHLQNEYEVPPRAQCKSCHMNGSEASLGGEPNGVVTPLGFRTLELNRQANGMPGVNQLDLFEAVGLFDAPLPASATREALVPPFGDGDLTERVRAYWEGNCAHCHRAGGYASATGLRLDYASTDPTNPRTNQWGVCKIATSVPGACPGSSNVDVVPGDPDASLMSCRMAAALDGPDAKVHMPPYGVHMVDAEGLALVREWIASLAPGECQ